MNTYKHSGAFGDLIYSLIVPRHTGGGEFYLHLNQMDWIGQHYYGSPPADFHKGRLNQKDFDFLAPFIEAQEYITKVGILDPNATEISHNLDRFRPLFVGHPCNYLDLYASIFGLFNISPEVTDMVKTGAWLNVPKARPIQSRPVVINRTTRWVEPGLPENYNRWKNDSNWEDHSVFVGLKEEYERFRQLSGWIIPHQPCSDMLELAEYIAGAQCFVGNQSMCLSLAVGLGVSDIRCERRRDMPIERNECYFPERGQIEYF